MSQPVKVFLSCSDRDEELHDQLLDHLRPLEVQGLISCWQRRSTEAAPEWNEVTEEAIESADIILLLVTPQYLASSYIWDVELQRVMERHDSGASRVIPLILRPTDWMSAPFSKLQVLPRNAKPLTVWENQEAAFQDIVKGIREVISLLEQPLLIDENYPQSDNVSNCNIFVSHSHKDDDIYHELMIHLSSLERQKGIEIWSDKLISAGSEWDSEIRNHLEQADIFIVLLTPSYLASRYLQEVELRKATERFWAGEVQILPVNIRPVAVPSDNILSSLQYVLEKPVTFWENRDEAWSTVARKIQDSIRNYIAGVSVLQESMPEFEKESIEEEYLDKQPDTQQNNLSEFIPRPLGNSIRIGRLHDKEKLCLRANEYAEALATVMTGASGEVCFALFGHWGRGKTYLMKLVEEKLSSREYECVWFSAWKYRSKPEIWIYFYETLRRKAIQGEGWFKGLVRRSRIFTVKAGIGTIFTFLVLFALSLMIPFGLFGIIIIPIIFVFGVAYSARLGMSLFGTWNNLNRITGLSQKSFQLAEHHEKLGLQEVIGDDLKTLLIGWVGFGKDNGDFRRSFIKFWKRRYFVLYLALATALSVVIHSSIERTNSQLRKIAEFIGNLSSHSLYRDEFAWLLSYTNQISENLMVSDFVKITFPAIFFIAMILVLLAFLKLELSKSKVLLIVDDLDRLPSDEILEIIESLKLLLEEEIQDLIQVVVICEEKSLEKALLKKYKSLYDEHDSTSANRLVEENIQKLFISHLRLPPLSFDEQKEFLESFIDYKHSVQEIQNYKQADTVANDDVSSRNDKVLDVNSVFSPQLPHEDSNNFWDIIKDYNLPFQNFEIKPPVRGKHNSEISKDDLEHHEKMAIYNSLDKLSQWVTPGPRAIQSFVFRYKLARELLKARGKEEIDAFYLATLLASSLSKSLKEEKIDEKIKNVLEEVT